MSPNKHYFRASFFVLVVLIVSACGQASLTPTPIPPTATPRPSGKIDVGGYQLAYQCYGQGEPTVIFDAEITFYKNDSGEVDRLTMLQFGETLEGKKVP